MKRQSLFFWFVAICVLLLATTLRIYFFVESIKYVPVSPDEALTVLGAKEVARGNFPLLVMAQPYQFPLESYLYMPLLDILPRNTFGARLLIVFESFLLTLIVLWLLTKNGGIKNSLPGVILFLFPSAYLLTIQFGYSLPHNMPIYVLCFLSLLILENVDAKTESKLKITRLFLAGLLLGISFPVNMLALSLIIPIFIVGVTRAGISYILTSTLVMGIGLLIGTTPYWLAIYCESEGAHKALTGTRDIVSALSYLKVFLIYVLPRTTGLGTTLFPDCNYYMKEFDQMLPFLGFGLMLLFFVACVIRIRHHIRQVRNNNTFQLNTFDAMVGVFILSALLFCFSQRATSVTLRYAVPAVMAIPFLVNTIYSGIKSALWKKFLMIAVSLIAFLNIVISLQLVRQWKNDSFIVKIADIPPLDQVIEFLLSKGITRCVATHYDAYRINFLTDEKIICTQPMNERFPRWKLPYKAEVYSSTNVAFVLTDVRPATFGCMKFENDMEIMGMRSERKICGFFTVYYNFETDPLERSHMKLSNKQIKVIASHNTEFAKNAADGDFTSRWGSKLNQSTNMWLHFIFDKKITLAKIKLHYRHFYNDRAIKLKIESCINGTFYEVPIKQHNDIDPFEIVNGIPCYGNPVRTIYLQQPVELDNVRIAILEPRKHRNWTIIDVDFYCSLKNVQN